MMTQQWETVLKDVISEVLETMFFSVIEFEDGDGAMSVAYESEISIFNHTGRIDISLRISEEFAKTMTANLLGLNEEQVLEDELQDTLKEFANMVGGSYHAKMQNSHWRLGIPRAKRIAESEEASSPIIDPELHFGCFGEAVGSASLKFIPDSCLAN